MAWLATLLPKFWAIAAALAAFAVAYLRIRQLEYSKAKWEQRAKGAEAQIQFEVDVDAADSEVSSEFSDMRERAKVDREEGKVPENLRDPNRW